MPVRHTVAAAAITLCCLATLQAAHAYSALYVFGDSLSDAGNDFLGSGGLLPAAPYAGGLFSNGPTWAHGLAAKLGTGPLLPSALGGTDFAFGGATTGAPSTPPSALVVPSLVQQVGLFGLATGGVAPSTALYAVWVGANDVLNIISTGAPGGLTPAAATQLAAQEEVIQIEALAAAGARTFVVPLLPDLGKTPTLTSVSSAAAAAGTALAALYNATLEGLLGGGSGGVSITYLDTFSLIDEAVANPAAFGLTDAAHPCYGGSYFGGVTPCALPDSYLFWDQLHPTAAGHAIIASAAFEAVPEPATLGVLGFGLTALLLARRPRRAG